MTTKRKILTALFLILFVCGGLLAVAGRLAGTFVYWFILAVVFTGLWFLLGPSSTPTEGAILMSKTKVFFSTFARTIGILLLIATVAIVVAVSTSADAGAVGYNIGRGLAIGTLWALIRSAIKASRHMEFLAKPPEGLDQKYTLEQLREDFLSGKVTPEWVVRSQGQTVYRSVSDVLYPGK